MWLMHLKASYFRNINTLNLNFKSRFNLIYGENGSGKSSLLEMIYCLGRGRSFRTNLLQPVIQYQAKQCHVFGIISSSLSSTTIGFQKTTQNKTKLKIGFENQPPSFSELAKLLPIQLIHPECHDLINHGADLRRQFLNWGMFHVEPQFLSLWRRFHYALKQRNTALQQRQSFSCITAWDPEIIVTGGEIVRLRQDYFNQFQVISKNFLSQLSKNYLVELIYHPGWNSQEDLSVMLEKNLNRDFERGYTREGPHRFDLLLRTEGLPVKHILSRGEQKRLICALYLAQGFLVKQLSGKSCVYLLDDVMAELDADSQTKVWKVLQQIEAQVFVTAISRNTFNGVDNSEMNQRFYVNEGKVMEIS